MIISTIYNKLSIEQKEDFVFGLVSGLVSGLVFGLVSGLVVGLVFGLVFGLVSGLVVILVNWNQALPFIAQYQDFILLTILIIIIAEILFWLGKKEKVSKEKQFWHTTKRKFEAIFETILGLSAIAQVYILIRELKIKVDMSEVLKWTGYIGFGIICLGLIVLAFYVWIKLNQLKYKK